MPRKKTPIEILSYNKTVGANIKLKRRLASLSQKQLAAKMNLTAQQLQKYENGKNSISSGRLQQIAYFLKEPVEVFFRDVKSLKVADYDTILHQMYISEDEGKVLQFYRKFSESPDPKGKFILKVIDFIIKEWK